MNLEKGMLEDYKINVKFKLSAFWTSVMFCYIYGDYFELYAPKKVEGLISGANMLDSPTKLLLASIILAIPALMIFMSFLLRPTINRRLNIILGVLYTSMTILIVITTSSEWYTFYVFLAILESLITSLIVWYAWKWPKKIAN